MQKPRMTALSMLKQTFGYEAFRDGQGTLIDGILAGRDVLGIMPTGAGKSICFQLPALMMDGLTLIVSPLISLMKDQVNALTQSGIAAAYINSSLTERQIDRALQNARNGAYKLIYIAPERLLTPDFLSFAQSADIAMLTVDEAHCISQWGQDFRPSYARIPEFIASLAKRPVLSAFTATATRRVREDIVSLLALHDPAVLVTGFDRPNLFFEVQRPRDRFAALLSVLEDKKERCGIVYCTTRAMVEDVCDKLKQNGYQACRYHAGLPDGERRDNQDDFLYDRARIMVATNAFGMGIDKSNVSFVVHYGMPRDIESYYQEAGRAGRDGEPADCVLLYSAQDVRTNLWLIENARDVEYPDRETEEALKKRDRKRLHEMTSYCATTECLRGYILRYFGENPPDSCGNCGSCNTSFETADVTEETRKIISCVVRMKERFGANMVVDVLRGAKSKKLLALELDKLSTYGISERTSGQLHAIINHLIMAGYLIKTDDEYPVLKLGQRADEGLRGSVPVQMKMPKEEEQASTQRTRKGSKKAAAKPVDKRLFAVLRELRLHIASEQGVPAFVVFSDSTLTDMCMKTPTTSEEMLQVSGVGQVKLERYGERFLQAIVQYVRDAAETVQPSSGQLPSFDATAIEITEEAVTVSTVADRINCVLMQCGRDKTSSRRINDWLVARGFLQIVVYKNRSLKIPTDAGVQLGIHREERLIRGEKVLVNLYEEAAQDFVVRNALEILDFET